MAQLLSGTQMRTDILDECREQVIILEKEHAIQPGLVTILVGNNPASMSYVSLKIRTALDLGFHEIQDNLPEDITQEALLERIESYNRDPAIHGILVQLPLPTHINANAVINAIDPDKDVDGFHPVNLGRLVLGGQAIRFLPCTPAGIQQMLIRGDVQTEGADITIVGRSNIVGKPLAIMLGQKGVGANATVTLAHTGTKNLQSCCSRADILIVAAGVPDLVQASWIKEGATVIDVGVNRVGTAETGKAILKGDVDFEAASQRAGKITPVPGGVGPMTIAMLMKNTVHSASLFAKNKA